MEKLENDVNTIERQIDVSPHADMSDESDSCKVIRNTLKMVQIPKVVQVKSAAPQVSRVQSTKSPSGLGAIHTRPHMTKLDKIVDNLKSMKEQQMKEKPLNVQVSNKIPRVSLININGVRKESEEKISQKEDEKLVSQPKIKNQPSLTPFQENILNYKFSLNAEGEESQEKENDLTNLSWLTNFNLNVPPLSPPLSPPQVAPMHSAKISAMSSSFDDDEDEADGCHQMKTPISTQIRQIMQDCIAKVNKTNMKRPPFSFSSLAFMAIESSERKRLSIKEIYNWIIETFPYYQSVPSGSWKNSIRFNLANNKCFAKVDKNQLAMRDFSGKGSLWCTNATYRSMLLDQLIKTNDLNKVTSTHCLQDKHDTFKMSQKTNRESDLPTSSSIKSSSSIRFRNKNLPKTNIIINPLLVNRFVVKPKLTHVSTDKPRLDDLDQSSELDAVNALLSMKTNLLNQMNKGSSMTSACSRQGDYNKKGRRKSLFRRPVKNTCVDEPVDEEKQLNEDYDEEDLCNSDDFEGLNDDEDEQLQYENESETTKRKRTHEENSDSTNNRKHRRLLVKFPYFKNAQQNKANKNGSESIIEHENQADLVTRVPRLPSKSISNSTKLGSSRKKQPIQTPNALLQLSRAASLIEENK
jgi:hypothetical protein